MLRNYLTIAFRSLRKQKIFSVVNITGLAVGLASCLIILLYVKDELSYDKFHTQASRIYRLVEERHLTALPRKFATAVSPLASVIQKGFENVKTVRVYRFESRIKARPEDEELLETDFYYVDSTFFDVFDFSMIKGDKYACLQKPFSIVISQDVAKQYFGDKNPIGKTLIINEKFEFTVCGIMENVPSNSHITIDFLASFSTIEHEIGVDVGAWWAPQMYIYVLLPPENPKATGKKIEQYIENNTQDMFESERVFTLQPLTDIHLFSHFEKELKANSNISYLYIFSSIALLILIIATLNFMNLSTAKSAKRGKEVGLRKTIGASRQQLIWQFLSESILLVMISLLFALALIELSLPKLNLLFDKNLRIDYLNDYTIYFLFCIIVLIVGVGSGSYPAFYLSKFKPVRALTGHPAKTKGKSVTRSVLVIIQFTISIILISATILISLQMTYIRNKNLGFRKENILVVPLSNTMGIDDKFYELKNELLQNPYIKDVTFSAGLPGIAPDFEFPYRIDQTPDKGTLPNIRVFPVDFDFMDTYNLQLTEGRKFLKNKKNDARHGFIINETAQRLFGWENAISKKFTLLQFNGQEMEAKQGNIIGVVKDFHYHSLHHAIEPLVIEISPTTEFFSYLSVYYQSGKSKQTLKLLKRKWNALDANRVFRYFFLDDYLDSLYRKEQKMSFLLHLFAGLAIFIACLGLFGLAAYSAEQRTKEIGIRKALGASVLRVTVMLTKDFMQWVLLAVILAWLPAYLFLKNWLHNFAYKVGFDVLTSLLIVMAAGIVAIFVAIITVMYQSIKTAIKNPVESLKYE